MAVARDLQGQNFKVVAVIGDPRTRGTRTVRYGAKDEQLLHNGVQFDGSMCEGPMIPDGCAQPANLILQVLQN